MLKKERTLRKGSFHSTISVPVSIWHQNECTVFEEKKKKKVNSIY